MPIAAIRLLPYDRFTLRSDSPPEVLEARLANLLSRRAATGAIARPFGGTVSGRRFRLVREPADPLGPSRRSLPVLVGELVPVSGGTDVRVSIRPAPLMAAVAAGWAIVLVLLASVAAWKAQRLGWWTPAGAAGGAWHALASTALLAVAGWGLHVAPFRTELARTRAAIREALRCRELGATVLESRAPVAPPVAPPVPASVAATVCSAVRAAPPPLPSGRIQLEPGAAAPRPSPGDHVPPGPLRVPPAMVIRPRGARSTPAPAGRGSP